MTNNIYDKVIINSYEKHPFVEVKIQQVELSKLQKQLIFLAALDFRLKQKTFPRSNLRKDSVISFSKQKLAYIESNAYNNLYQHCMIESEPLIPCFLISKKLITDDAIFRFSKTFNLFSNFSFNFHRQHEELKKLYKEYLIEDVIIKYSKNFSIKYFCSIIKYPNIMLDMFFKEFSWKEATTFHVQKPSIKLLIKHIEEIDKNIMRNIKKFLKENDIKTIQILKEML